MRERYLKKCSWNESLEKKSSLNNTRMGFHVEKKNVSMKFLDQLVAGLNVNWVMNEIIKSERIQSMTSVKENEIEQSTPWQKIHEDFIGRIGNTEGVKELQKSPKPLYDKKKCRTQSHEWYTYVKWVWKSRKHHEVK